MTWRPTKFLLEGELDNSKPGRVTGWLRFAGLEGTVTVNLKGDFDRDIRGARIVLRGRYSGKPLEAEDEMEGFAQCQTGVVGNITAGLVPQAYAPYPYIEWLSDSNDRVVLMPEAEHVTVISTVSAPAEPDRRQLRGAVVRRTELPALNASGLFQGRQTEGRYGV